jgi:hypothetical protein
MIAAMVAPSGRLSSLITAACLELARDLPCCDFFEAAIFARGIFDSDDDPTNIAAASAPGLNKLVPLASPQLLAARKAGHAKRGRLGQPRSADRLVETATSKR